MLRTELWKNTQPAIQNGQSLGLSAHHQLQYVQTVSWEISRFGRDSGEILKSQFNPWSELWRDSFRSTRAKCSDTIHVRKLWTFKICWMKSHGATKVTRIHHLGAMNVCNKMCCQSKWLMLSCVSGKLWPVDGARWKVKGSTKIHLLETSNIWVKFHGKPLNLI